MRFKNKGNQLPIHDIKNYERKFLNNSSLFSVEDKKEIPYVIHRMRKSKTDAELFDDRNYIYNENEKDNLKLNTNQIDYIKNLAKDLELEYAYLKGIHFVYKFELFS